MGARVRHPITDLSLSAALSEAVNELNQRYLFGKFFWDGRRW